MNDRASEKTLILGGVRSGKSRYAGELAAAQSRTVTMIVTGTAQDEEMAARIATHRASRPAHWSVIEEPLQLAAALRRAATADAAANGVIVVDCLTLWLSNLLCLPDEDRLRRESASLLEMLPVIDTNCILISNEVGFGIIPASPLARRFGDAVGTLHQRLAQLCDRVVLVVAGLPMILKGGAHSSRGATS
jgi:adenosylcobinamide kinase/adenosylcobinamide-phosphate guanylyltransferase